MILHIGEEDIDTRAVLLGGEVTCDLEQNTHPTATIVGTIDRFIGAFIVLISEGAGVPMRQQQNALLPIGMELADDVAQRQAFLVVADHGTGLFHHGGTSRGQARHHPIAASRMRLRAGHAWAKGHLAFNERIGTIRIEGGCGRKSRSLLLRHGGAGLGWLGSTTGQDQDGEATSDELVSSGIQARDHVVPSLVSFRTMPNAARRSRIASPAA